MLSAAARRRGRTSETGRWTHRIIWDIRKCIECSHDEVGFELTRLLSLHEGYWVHLYRFEHDESPYCPKCPNIEEDAEHILFHCPTFAAQRAALEATTLQHLKAENIMDYMLKVKSKW